jgi:general secretion pathway protein N
MMQVRYQDEQLNNVRWDIAGWQLFTGNLNANLKFGNPRLLRSLFSIVFS